MDDSFRAVAATAGGEAEPPLAEITVLAEGAEDVLRTAHQQAAQRLVPGLRVAQLRRAVPRLVLARRHPLVGADAAAVLEVARGLERQDEAQGRERADTADLSQSRRLQVLLRAEPLGITVVLPHLVCQALGLVEHWPQHRAQGLGDVCADLLCEGSAGRRGQPFPEGLRLGAAVIDQPRPALDDAVAGTHHQEVAGGIRLAVPDRREELRVEAAQASQGLDVIAVGLPSTMADQPHLARIGDEALVPHLLELLLHPGAVRADLEGDAAARAGAKSASEPRLGRGNLELLEDLACRLEDDGHRAPVADVKSDGLRDEIRAYLSHGRSPVWATRARMNLCSPLGVLRRPKAGLLISSGQPSTEID